MEVCGCYVKEALGFRILGRAKLTYLLISSRQQRHNGLNIQLR